MPTGGTPEDRVLRWVVSAAGASSKGVPLNTLVRQLKGDLTGLDFARLQLACQNLEAAGLLTRDWFGPADFVVRPTEAGTARANQIEKAIGHRRSPAESPTARPPPETPPPFAPAAPAVTPAPPPATLVRPAVAPPILGVTPGARPEANLPVRILLYAYLYAIGAGSNQPVAGAEIRRYLDGQGVLLPEGQLDKMAAEMQSRGFLHYSTAGPGEFEVLLTAKGLSLAEGLLAGKVPPASRSPSLVEAAAAASAAPGEAVATVEDRPFQLSSPTAAAGPPPTTAGSGGAEVPDAVQDAWMAAENEIVRLQGEVERLHGELERLQGELARSLQGNVQDEAVQLRADLAQALEDKRLDRETLDEVLHQLEELTRRVQEQDQELARLRTAPGSG